MTPDLMYDYHDSTIVGAEMTPGRGIVLRINLYSIFYPSCPTVDLRFTGIFNSVTTERMVRAILSEGEDGLLGCRIECLQYDTTKPSTDGSLYIFIKTEWEGGHRIHCRNLSVETISEQGAENDAVALAPPLSAEA